jgi:hypothetical protein
MAKSAKICRNPDCGETLFGNRKDCNDKCKNKFHYLKNLKENKPDIEWYRKYKFNKRVINDLFMRGKTIVTLAILEAMGFNFDFLKEKELKTDGTPFYTINNYYLIIESKTQIIIEKIK